MTKDEAKGTTCMATLVRGRVYVYKRRRFERQVPQAVTEEFASELEELFDELHDNDPDTESRQVRRKPLFRIERVAMVEEATKFTPGSKAKKVVEPAVKLKPRPVTRIGS